MKDCSLKGINVRFWRHLRVETPQREQHAKQQALILALGFLLVLIFVPKLTKNALAVRGEDVKTVQHRGARCAVCCVLDDVPVSTS